MHIRPRINYVAAISIFVSALAPLGNQTDAQQPHPTQPTVKFRGRVVTADGRPAADANVAVALDGEGIIWIRDNGRVSALGKRAMIGLFGDVVNEGGANATTDKAGEFQLQLPAPGRYVVCIGHEKLGWALRTNLNVPAISADAVNFTLEPPAVINAILPSPLPDRRAQSLHAELIWPDSDKLEHAGVFCSIFVSSTKMQVGPLPSHHRYRVAWNCFTQDKNRQDHVTLKSFIVDAVPRTAIDVNFAQVDPGRIVGRLTDRDDRPLRDVTVQLILDAAADTRMGTLTDKDGRYILAGPPAGRHRLAFLRHEPVPG